MSEKTNKILIITNALCVIFILCMCIIGNNIIMGHKANIDMEKKSNMHLQTINDICKEEKITQQQSYELKIDKQARDYELKINKVNIKLDELETELETMKQLVGIYALEYGFDINLLNKYGMI